MTEIVDLEAKRQELLNSGPHLSASCVCLACRHKWQAVAPVGTIAFRCPECGVCRGVSTEHCRPSETPVWHCACGCWVFAVMQDSSIMCVACGVEQRF